jgi:hypothetical protein
VLTRTLPAVYKGIYGLIFQEDWEVKQRDVSFQNVWSLLSSYYFAVQWYQLQIGGSLCLFLQLSICCKGSNTVLIYAADEINVLKSTN